jgi:thiosulfate/3-mercaptopyruvate sulfurtransferase
MGFSGRRAKPDSMIEELTAAELQAKLEAGEDVQIVDTRAPDDYAAGHIPGAENLPYGELAARIDEMEWGESVVLVCEIGRSSKQAARILDSYEGVGDDALVASLEGGYEDWEYDLES